jgi:hypothetical protein
MKPDESAGSSLPSIENAGAYRDRLLAWTADLGPRDDVQRCLVWRAVALSCELDRADSAQSACPKRGDSRRDPGPAQADTIAAADPQCCDADEPGERLRQRQLAGVQALVDTLDVFIRLRRFGELGANGSTAPPAPAEAPLPPVGPEPGCSDRARQEAAAPSPGKPQPALVAVSERGEAPSPDHPPIRHRIANRRRRQPDWPATSRPSATRDAASGERCDPVVRSSRDAETSWSPADSRRCVGGYPVPLDASVSASRADRVPIRLRRQECGVRRARGTS